MKALLLLIPVLFSLDSTPSFAMGRARTHVIPSFSGQIQNHTGVPNESIRLHISAECSVNRWNWWEKCSGSSWVDHKVTPDGSFWTEAVTLTGNGHFHYNFHVYIGDGWDDYRIFSFSEEELARIPAHLAEISIYEWQPAPLQLSLTESPADPRQWLEFEGRESHVSGGIRFLDERLTSSESFGQYPGSHRLSFVPFQSARRQFFVVSGYLGPNPRVAIRMEVTNFQTRKIHGKDMPLWSHEVNDTNLGSSLPEEFRSIRIDETLLSPPSSR